MFRWLLSGGDFLPHEYCYLRNPALIHLHFWSDLLIAASYVLISLTLLYLVRKSRREIPFHWMFLAFGAFIIACGTTHLMEVWTLWTPVYWLSGIVKAVTAAASVTTAILLPPLVPRTVDLVRAAKSSDARREDLKATNETLRNEIAERRRAEQQVRTLLTEMEQRVRDRTADLEAANGQLAELAAIVEHSQDAIFSRSMDGTVTSWNPAAERIYGFTAAEMVGNSVMVMVPPDKHDEVRAVMERVEQGEEVPAFETERLRKNGSRMQLHVTVSPLKDSSGAVRGASVIARDITDQRRSELQLQQVQKLESLGVIAGGVAHDFNNLLVGIMGNASLALESMAPSSPNYQLLNAVVAASERAAHLTQQLLAYAGKGRFLSEKVNLSSLTREISSLIQTSIARTVTLRMELEDSLAPIEADPGQIQQVIMNLVINAAEAAGDQPGSVLVTTSELMADEEYLKHNLGVPLPPGRYVVLEVHDTGCGMDEALRARIFDPFFTTKFTGRGLGLSAVMGIVRSHKGAIRVYSEPGKGSTFKVLLPAAEGTADTAAALPKDTELRGSGLILVIDDEEMVRSAARTVLERHGYSVITAEDGLRGVEVYRERADVIRAVLLDMTMPVMPGTEAFRQIRNIRPDARVVLSSGYNEMEATRRFTAKGIAAFIQKPYTASALARVMKQAVES